MAIVIFSLFIQPIVLRMTYLQKPCWLFNILPSLLSIQNDAKASWLFNMFHKDLGYST